MEYLTGEDMAEVILENVSKIFPGNVEAVKDVSIEILDKEFVVLVGSSGCGKSTTLRMVAGLEEVTSGEIQIDGKVVNDVPPKDRDIAMVFQNYALYPHMSVRQNMAFGLKLRRYDKKEIEQRVQEAAKILELEELLDRKPKALSGGQRQRVAVGRAIVRKPKVFLFDEPLSNLDAKLRNQMRAELALLHRKLESTIIYVTHDQVEAMTLGSKIVVMNKGRIQQVDSPLSIYEKPKNQFVAGFIGSPKMNFVKGEIENGLFKGNQVTCPLTDDQKNQITSTSCMLGIRPEHLRVEDQGIDNGSIKGEVRFVESYGYETFIHINVNDTLLIARSESGNQVKINSSISVGFKPSKAHFFDQNTEQTLTS